MFTAHLHLLSNHVPLLGFFFGGLILFYGLIRKNAGIMSGGYLALVFAGIGGIIAYFTGEPAEDAVKGIAGVATRAIGEHEEAAGFAIFCIGIVALLSVQGFIWALKENKNLKKFTIVVLILVLIGIGIISRTAYLGGKIRHTEFYTNTGAMKPANVENQEGEDKD